MTSTVSLMSFLVTWGSVATIATLISVGLFFLWFTRSRVVNPLMNLTGAIDQLAGGKQSVTIPYADHIDEIGTMARAVLVLKQNTIEKLRLEAEQAALKQQSELERRRVLGIWPTGSTRASAMSSRPCPVPPPTFSRTRPSC